MMIGKTLAHYEIVTRLGAGGMGEVYQARDLKLCRMIALKVLPRDFASDAERLARFQREARLIAALNHPNIVTVFSVEEVEGSHFLTMELVAGETLEALLPARGFALRRFFELAVPILDAVAAAHDQGIVHRDLKTTNVMVTEVGQRVKILDFGLAKAIGPRAAPAATDLPTDAMTREGVVAGTLPYMSPEQIEGKPVDSRTDIFSLGILLHEMLTGSRPFQGDTSPALMSSILRDAPPPVDRIRPDVSRQLAQTIERCLEKAPDGRFQTAHELSQALAGLSREQPSDSGSLPNISAFPASAELEVRRSIAVLPFLNRSGNPDDEYFSDGLSEELINALGKLSGVKVTARGSAFQFRGRELDVREVGRKLGVDAVLEGSVRIAGRRLRITTELASCDDGLQLWSGRFDGEMRDVFETQDQIVRSIVDQLELQLDGESDRPLVKHGTENLEAYHLLLKARHHMTEFWEPGLLAALECLEQAVELDPGYAQAHSVMAECYLIRSNFGNLPGKEAFPRVLSAVRRALELDPELGDARGIHAIYLAWHDFDWPAAEREMELALRYSPQNVWNHLFRAAMLATSRRTEEIVTAYRPALDLDPLNPVVHVHSTLLHFYAGQTEKAASDARRSQELFPDYWLIPYFQSFVSWQQRDGGTAVALIERAVEMTGGSLPYVACYAAAVHFFFGNEQAGERWLAKVERMAESQFVPPTGRALVEIARGRTREAIDLLEQAHAEHDTPFVWIRALCERLDIIADDRIRTTMKRLSLP